MFFTTLPAHKTFLLKYIENHKYYSIEVKKFLKITKNFRLKELL
jgi:hypothetical protein